LFFLTIAGRFCVMLAVAFTIALFAQPPQSAQAGDATEALIRRIQGAVEAGTDSAERVTLLGLRRANPSDRTALLALATLDRLVYQDDEAERGYSAVMKGGRDELTAYALLGLGALGTQQARLADAEPLLRQSAGWLEQNGRRKGATQALIVLGIVRSRSVGLDSALAILGSAARVIPRDDVWLRSLLDCNVIMIRVRKAEPRAPILARPTADAAVRSGNMRAAATCLAALAQDYERRTLMDSALATFTEVAALQRAARNFAALAGTRQWQGFVLLSRGRYPEARAMLNEALALGEQTRSDGVVSWASLSLADLSLTFGDLVSAGSHARKAAVSFEATGDRWGLLISRMHAGDVALLSRSFPAAREAYEQVAHDSKDVSPTVAVHARGRLAFTGLLEGDASEAERHLDIARRLSIELDMPEWRLEDTYTRALIALQRGQLAESDKMLQQLRSMLPSGDLLHVDVLTRLAEVHVRAGEPARAEADLISAGALVDGWRASLSQRELRAAVLQARRMDWDRDLGFATVIHHIARAGRDGAAFQMSEQRRARVMLEEVARRQSLSSRPAEALTLPALLSEADIRRVLPDSTAVS
jgi:tetratricopeptide (TPR) repeat protein